MIKRKSQRLAKPLDGVGAVSLQEAVFWPGAAGMASPQLNKVMLHLRRAVGAPDDADSDGGLLQRFVGQQDEGAFALLLNRYGPMVLGVCRRALGNTADAEDAFQATFLVLIRKAGSLRDAERVGNWLYGVACRIARRARIQAARRGPQVAEVPDMATEPEPVEGQELRPLLDEELQRLPRKYRVPLVLCYLEGKTNEAAAQQLHWPAGTVKTRLARGRDLLRDRLARRGLALSATALAAALAPEAVTAAVPPALADATLKAAGLYTAGSAAGAVSASVLTLTEGAVREALRAKVQAILAIMLACGLFAGGAGWAAYASLGGEAAVVAEPIVEPEPPPPAPVLEDGGLAVSVEQRVHEWQPNSPERRLDEISWASDLRTALRLARQHQRPLLVLDFGGDIATARCPASAFNLRAGALSSDRIIARLNERFVCVYLNNQDYRPGGRAVLEEKAELERIREQVAVTAVKGHGNRVYLLGPDGKLVACEDGCKVASTQTLAPFLERWTGETTSNRGSVVPPAVQSRPPQAGPDALVLHLTARYLQRRGNALLPLQPLWGNKTNYFMKACPGESWIVLDAVRSARFLPTGNVSLGASWEVPPDLAEPLFRAMYPPTEDNDLSRNRIDEGTLKATVVAVRGDSARARLEGQLTMQHRFAPSKDDNLFVHAELEGFFDFTPGQARIRSFRLVSTRAVYGKADFGIAVRSLSR